ncbi:alpha/beta-hydrolase [Setomelanomma holmii]|uniref:Alpha/beta-hydrolase n=1 Tax=Setomelanomma holmii TaxID=210430 RepID=A0A9P4HA70_9PLEO|nr:alpha/beta-hydrolase [Setomelanomma holmii]
MRPNYSALALALALSATSVLALDCPTGYEKSQIEWNNCPVQDVPTLQCSTLEVPLDYAKPAGDVLYLRLVRIPASSANPRNKSIIFNPGGPGSPGIDSLIDEAYGLDIQKIAGNDFHLIGFDPRGTGLSIPYNCTSLNRSPAYKDTDSNIQRLLNELSLQAAECAKSANKERNELMGTAYVARDVKSIAEALGEDGLIRYMGYSYGTLLGATVAAMFPKSIDRMLLDGNINPTDYYYGLGEESAADYDGAVVRFFDLCAEAGPSNCAIAVAGQSGAQLKQRYDSFLSNLTYAQSYAVRGQFFDSMYAPSLFKNRANTIRGYYNNSTRIPRRSLDRRADDDNEDDDVWYPADSGMAKTPLALQGITCADYIPKLEASVSNFKAWRDLWISTSKYGGDQAFLTTLYMCSLWQNDAKEKFAGPYTNVETKSPILFVNTQYDPVTPLISAQNSSAGFLKSRVLVSSGGGHCSVQQPSTELDAAIKQYFDDASFPMVEKIYEPDHKNAFITPPKNTTVAVKRKRTTDHADLFAGMPSIVKRQSTIPVGCVKMNGTSSSSNNSTGSSYGNYGGSSGGSSRSAGYGDYSGASTRSAGYSDYYGGSSSSARPSTQSAGYGGYAGYGYADSTPSSKRPSTITTPAGSVPTASCITKTITDFTYETITKCSGNDYCQVGSVVTKTNVRTTTFSLKPKTTPIVVTVKSIASSAPGQGYNVPPSSNKPGESKPVQSSAPAQSFAPAQSSAPAVSNPVYGTPAKASSSAPVDVPSKPLSVPAIQYSASRATNNVYSVPTGSASTGVPRNGTKSSGTPTGNYPAQFTGKAATDRAALSLIAFVAAFASLAFIL